MPMEDIPYELLIKYCKKQTSHDENRYVSQWLSDNDNLSLFLNLKEEWQFLDDDSAIAPDKHLLWRKIEKETYSRKDVAIRGRFRLYKAAVAALIVCLIAVSVCMVYLLNSHMNIEPAEQFTIIATGTNEKSNVVLPDGSKVWLNSNSTISFGNRFNNSTREISASGELFFDVMPADNKFVIDAGQFKVEVLGTSFNLKTATAGNEMEISLIEGRVAVVDSDNNRQLFTMDSMQYAVIDKSNASFAIHSKNTTPSNTWTKEELSVYNEPLIDIIPKLESWYGISIICSEMDLLKTYTFHLQDEKIEEFFSLFSFMISVDYTLDDNKLYLKGRKND